MDAAVNIHLPRTYLITCDACGSPQTNNKFTCREVHLDIKINEAQIKNVFPKAQEAKGNYPNQALTVLLLPSL